MKLDIKTAITVGAAALAVAGFIYRLSARVDLLEWRMNYAGKAPWEIAHHED